MPVVEGEVESMMFTAGRMRGDQHVMKALGVVPLCWRFCGVCLSRLLDGRSEELPLVEA